MEEVALKSPIDPKHYPMLTVVLCSMGTAATARFVYYQLSVTKYSRKLQVELVQAAQASLYLGFGILFLLLWTGVYV